MRMPETAVQVRSYPDGSLPGDAGRASSAMRVSDTDFSRLSALVRDYTGILISHEKRQTMAARLEQHVRALGLSGFAEYAAHMEAAENSADFSEMVSRLTTNLTGFFRDTEQFLYLEQYLGSLAADIRTRRRKRRLRIWSAACASGQEPYSIAMTVAAAIPDFQEWDIRILATDIDTRVLDQAIEAAYSDAELKGVPAAYRRWFTTQERGFNVIDARLRDMVTFRNLNLMNPWPMTGPFDVVFCRNVLIYFEQTVQTDLVSRIAGITGPEGRLMLGRSEVLPHTDPFFVPADQSVYRPRAGAVSEPRANQELK